LGTKVVIGGDLREMWRIGSFIIPSMRAGGHPASGSGEFLAPEPRPPGSYPTERHPVSKELAPRKRAGRFARAVVAIAIAMSVGVAGIMVDLHPEGAQAATKGYGYEGGTSCTGCGAGWLGSVNMPGGVDGFCIDPIGLFPSGTATSSGYVTSIAGTSSATWPGHNDTQALDLTDIKKINYILVKYVSAMNTDTEGAAIDAYVYSRSVAGNLAPYGISTAEDYVRVRVPASKQAAVLNLLAQYKTEANANYNKSATATPQVVLNMTSGFDGTVTTSIAPVNDVYGKPLVGTVTLTGAVFNDTGLTTAVVGNGAVLAITGTPLDSDTSKYSITASYSVTVPGAPRARVRLWTTSSPAYAQRDVSSGGKYPDTVVTAFDQTDDPIDLTFSPVLTTQVESVLVTPGEPYMDTVLAGVAGGSNPWRVLSDGSYVPIVAHGTLYGPFADPPTTSAAIPPGAPVLGTETITLNGPGLYSSPGSIVATDSGYATWVWTIDAADQPPRYQDTLPTGYVFADQFGQDTETHVVASNVHAVTTVNAADAAPGGQTWDSLDVDAVGGFWMTSGGSPIPVTFTGTAYWEAGDVAPTAAAGPPGSAVVLGTRSITATAPGTYTTESDPVDVPPGAGFVVWQWQVSEADQPEEFRGYIADWSDTYGLSAETTRVELPTMSTQALPETPLTATAYDTATVDGMVPGGSVLTFHAYRQPKVGEAVLDGAGDPVVDGAGEPVLYSAADVAAPLCTGGTRAFSSAPVAVSAGMNVTALYGSPAFTPAAVGTYYWIATLSTSGGDVLAQGDCGEAEETTEVTIPSAHTVAAATVVAGGTGTDTAYVSGLVAPGTTLVFLAYSHGTENIAAGDRGILVCDTSSAPVAVTAGANIEASYTSPACGVPAAATEIYWVERLLGPSGQILQEGIYGDPTETSEVQFPVMSTRALSETSLTDTANDTATVDGTLPAGSYLIFAAYRQPTAGDPVVDGAGVPVLDGAGSPVLYSAADVASPLCTAGTRAYSSARVAAAAGLNVAAEYASPAFTPAAVGTYHWIATLSTSGGDVLAQGSCGEAEETTEVTIPSAHTVAAAFAGPGGEGTDTAYVSGLVAPGTTLVFMAYEHGTEDVAAGERGDLVCDTAASPISVAAGVASETVYTSPSCTMPTAAAEIYWVERLLGPSGEVLHEGTYGDPAERTLVTPLASAGEVVVPLAQLAGGALAAGLVMLAAARWRRRPRRLTQ
jgi:hypothetical protein